MIRVSGRTSAGLPWGKPRHELLLLALIAVAALSTVYAGAVDPRLCLTQSMLHGHLSSDACLAHAVDRAEYGGHFYSDKAPGFSLLALPSMAVLRLPPLEQMSGSPDLRIWAVRLLTSGLVFLLTLFVFGRVAEGLAPGAGAPSVLALGLGTLLTPLSITTFGHVPSAALGFGAFLLAWNRRHLLAGVAAGLAVDVEYQVAFVAAVVGVYVLVRGLRAAGFYALGLVPGAAVLLAYDWAAFGSPLHVSYNYEASYFASQERYTGFFGIHTPTLHGTDLTLVGDRGLLWSSPVLVGGAAGLVLLWRAGRYRAEAAAAAAVTLLFLALEIGFFNPMGGDSPGPRYFTPAVPFLALGIPAAFARWRRPMIVLTTLSVVAMTTIALTWPAAVNSAAGDYRQTVWGELARLVVHGGGAVIVTWPSKTLLGFAGVHPFTAGVVSFVVALVATAITLAPEWRTHPVPTPSDAAA